MQKTSLVRSFLLNIWQMMCGSKRSVLFLGVYVFVLQLFDYLCTRRDMRCENDIMVVLNSTYTAFYFPLQEGKNVLCMCI